jgi:hypothetical protein
LYASSLSLCAEENVLKTSVSRKPYALHTYIVQDNAYLVGKSVRNILCSWMLFASLVLHGRQEDNNALACKYSVDVQG